MKRLLLLTPVAWAGVSGIIRNVFFESASTAHEWLTRRRCFEEFAPRLSADDRWSSQGKGER